MRSFQHLETALRLFHGANALDALPAEIDRLKCSRAVIVCGHSIASQGGGLERVRDALGGRCAGVFDGVRRHSPVDTVELAAAVLQALNADAIVAVGGGSAIVTARAAAILAAERKPAHELCTRRQPDGSFASPKLPAPKLPQFVIPTTPTTAAVKAGSAIFDQASGQRLAMFDPKTRAHSIFIDPALVGAAPVELLVTASLNTLAMAVEGLESSFGDMLSDGMLMQALRLLRDALPDLRSDSANDLLRSKLMLAAVLCGRGTDFAGGGVASVLGHALGARCHIENGLANAILLPHTMRFNAGATVARAGNIAEALGACQPAAHGIEQVSLLLDRIDIPRRLRDAGVPREALDEVAAVAMGDWFLSRNPRSVSNADELRELLLAAW